MPRGNPQNLLPNKKGQRRGGRKKGTPNKITVSMKEAFMNAFNGAGGEAALIAWGKKAANRRAFFQLVSKLIPTEVVGPGGGPLLGASAEVKVYLPDNARPAGIDGNKKP